MTDEKKYQGLGHPDRCLLSLACESVARAFDEPIFWVGSSRRIREYRDVDVRVILSEDRFMELFKEAAPNTCNPLWSLMCAGISLQLRSATGGMPVDFQIQSWGSLRDSEARGERELLAPHNQFGSGGP